MWSRTRTLEMRRWLLGFLAALVAALAAILSGTIASASATVGAETRVGAFNVAGEVLVGPPEDITAGQQLGNNPARVVTVVATGVATKSVDDLPTVNWGQQSKQFPGHPNFIPGRSTLTANPEALIQRAGTGAPVGSVPRGQAGFKERIDFGDSIGTYVSRDGTSSPTSIGILHYRADGSVHIIPGRPQ